MEEFGIRPEDLAAALATESLAKKAERYRSATGDSWDGNGDMPQWLRQAISAGQRLEHFELSEKPAPAPQPNKQVDWSNDPFAGTRLGRPNNR
jgi:DNA-binding protein H-NS